VTYLPVRRGFILTHNRDEHYSRSPQTLSREEIHKKKLIFPKDPDSGGSWIGVSELGSVACILNGAFHNHLRKPPYRRSRGLVLMDYFENEDILGFSQGYDFKGIEPFTMVAIESGAPYEIRWDGLDVHFLVLDENAEHFWSSATLYPKDIREQRRDFFDNWLSLKRSFTADEILHLHYKGGVGNPKYDFVMNRDGKVQTVSITQIIYEKNTCEMRYHDLISGKESQDVLEIREQIF
jgi:hypothetical protein